MTRSPGNKKDDPSFKTLLARLDGSFDTAPPYDLAPLTPPPMHRGDAARHGSKVGRGLLLTAISGGISALVLVGLFAYPWITSSFSAGAPAKLRMDAAGLDLTAALASAQPQPIAFPAAGPVAAQIAQPRTVRTQVIPVEAKAAAPSAAAPSVVQPAAATPPVSLPVRPKALAQAHAQQPVAREPDGPPVPLVSRPSPAAEPDRQSEPAAQAPPVIPPEAKLLVAPNQRARAGESTPIAIKVEVAGQSLDRLRVAFGGLADGVTFSTGESKSVGAWHAPVRGIEQLHVRLPATISEDMSLALELLDGGGNSLARATTHIIVQPAPPPPPKPAPPLVAAPAQQPPASSPPASMVTTPIVPAPPVQSPSLAAPPRLSMDEDTAMIERGRLLARNGDIAAARLMFERAADAGSGRAALLLGETYDPDVLAAMGVLGAKGDLAKARRWYARANELGVGVAAERLRALAGK